MDTPIPLTELWKLDYGETSRDLTARSQMIWAGISIFFAAQGIFLLAFSNAGRPETALVPIWTAGLGVMVCGFVLLLLFGERYRWSIDIERLRQVQWLLEPTLFARPNRGTHPDAHWRDVYSRMGAAGPNQEAVFELAAQSEREDAKGWKPKSLWGYRLSLSGVFFWLAVLTLAVMFFWSASLFYEILSRTGFIASNYRGLASILLAGTLSALILILVLAVLGLRREKAAKALREVEKAMKFEATASVGEVESVWRRPMKVRTLADKVSSKGYTLSGFSFTAMAFALAFFQNDPASGGFLALVLLTSSVLFLIAAEIADYSLRLWEYLVAEAVFLVAGVLLYSGFAWFALVRFPGGGWPLAFIVLVPALLFVVLLVQLWRTIRKIDQYEREQHG